MDLGYYGYLAQTIPPREIVRALAVRARRALLRGKPFFFRGPPQAVGSLQAIGVRAVGLANNHALDYEAEALLETLELLSEAGIAVAGAGRAESEARRGVIATAARTSPASASDCASSAAAAGRSGWPRTSPN